MFNDPTFLLPLGKGEGSKGKMRGGGEVCVRVTCSLYEQSMQEERSANDPCVKVRTRTVPTDVGKVMEKSRCKISRPSFDFSKYFVWVWAAGVRVWIEYVRLFSYNR